MCYEGNTEKSALVQQEADFIEIFIASNTSLFFLFISDLCVMYSYRS